MSDKKDYKYDNENNKYEWKRVWEYHKDAEHLFHQRFSFFLVAESMLIVSFVTLLNTSQELVKFAIVILGIVFTFGWLYVNLRLDIRMERLKVYLKENDQIYEEYMNSVKDIFGKFDYIQDCILPMTTFLFWMFLLLHILMKVNLSLTILLLIIICLLLTVFLKFGIHKNY